MLLLNSFEGMGIFEYLPFSLFLSLILSQLFHPSWRWKGCSMIASRVGKRALQTVFSKLWSPWSHTIYFTCTNPATLFQQKKSLQRISLCPMGLHVFLPSMILCMHVYMYVCIYWIGRSTGSYVPLPMQTFKNFEDMLIFRIILDECPTCLWIIGL